MSLEGERAVYATILGGTLEQIARAVESFPPDALDRHPHEGASSSAELAAHVVGAVRAWAVGIGCGHDVSRDRVAEFATAEVSAATLAADLRTLATELTEALGEIDSAFLDERLVPEQSLAGAAPARETSRRESIVSSIRHAGEHLGHLELTRDMLSD